MKESANEFIVYNKLEIGLSPTQETFFMETRNALHSSKHCSVIYHRPTCCELVLAETLEKLGANATSQNIGGGTDTWAVPTLNFGGDRPPRPPPMGKRLHSFGGRPLMIPCRAIHSVINASS